MRAQYGSRLDGKAGAGGIIFTKGDGDNAAS